MKRIGFFKAIAGGVAAAVGFKYIPAAVLPVIKVPPVHIGMVVRASLCPGNGWQLCNGAMLCGEYHQELFDVLGLQYGGSKDGTWFNIPDWRIWNLYGDGTSTETSDHWIKVE